VSERGADDLVGEDLGRGVDGRQMKLLLGAEVGEEAALADAEVVGQTLQRDRVEPFG
jgi:hypothetical protein